MDFFCQNKTTLDDNGLFHHRKNCRIAFLSNGRHGIDLTANRYSIDLHPCVIQRFIDKTLVLAGNGADLHHIALDLSFRYGEIFRVQREMCFPYWQFRRHGKPRLELKSDSLHPIFEWTAYTKKPATPDDLT